MDGSCLFSNFASRNWIAATRAEKMRVQDPGDSSSSTSTGTPEDFKYLTSILNFNFIKKKFEDHNFLQILSLFSKFPKISTISFLKGRRDPGMQ